MIRLLIVIDFILMMIIFSRSTCFMAGRGKGLHSRLMSRSFVHSPPKMAAYDSWPSSNIEFKTAYWLAVDYLNDCGTEEAETSARYLVCDVVSIGMRYSDFNAAMASDITLSKEQITELKGYVQKRGDKMPVQYILGNWDFYGLTLECKEPVLIPRPETEELIEKIISAKIIPENGKILDIGAGTGAIGLTLLSQLPGSTCEAIDINEVAVDLAKKNAVNILGAKEALSRYLCTKKSFEKYAYASIAATEGGEAVPLFDVIVSNPPYIPSNEMSDLMPEVKQYEDHCALHGGEDGLDLIRTILQLGPSLLSREGPRELWMEVARRHPKDIEELVKEQQMWNDANSSNNNGNNGKSTPHFEFVEGMSDLSGNPRFVRLRVVD